MSTFELAASFLRDSFSCSNGSASADVELGSHFDIKFAPLPETILGTTGLEKSQANTPAGLAELAAADSLCFDTGASPD
jgi:hypothetical protein